MDRIISRIHRFLDSRSKNSLQVISLMTLVLIGYIDYLTGIELSLSPFYLLPVAILTWYVSPARGVICAFLVTGITVGSDLANGLTFSHSAFLSWNIFMKLSFFLVVVALLAHLKKVNERRTKAEAEVLEHRENLQELVEKRTEELENTNVSLQAEIAERAKAEKELQDHRNRLEELVKERTEEIEQANRLLHFEVAEHMQAEIRINALLAEKEMLLREVHHRIKNNMSTMMSLLTLQAKALKEPSAVAALKEARGRLQSMGVMYDKLYRSKNYEEMSIRDFLTLLIKEAVDLFPNRDKVTVETSIPDFMVSVKTLSPLGIMVNELLTNTMKYAFTGRERGVIKVSLTKQANVMTLIFEDDGNSIPESVEPGKCSGFGLQLVYMLAEQLEGTVRIERQEGTRFILEFKN